MDENMIIEEMPTRQNPFTVISKFTWDNGGRDLQSNGSWSENPYGDGYAVVPDDMYEAIWETCGFCDIELSDDGTEVVSFTANEIPVFPEPEIEVEPTAEEMLNAMLGVTSYE